MKNTWRSGKKKHGEEKSFIKSEQYSLNLIFQYFHITKNGNLFFLAVHEATIITKRKY